jgi:FkbM family methyltransferase
MLGAPLGGSVVVWFELEIAFGEDDAEPPVLPKELRHRLGAILVLEEVFVDEVYGADLPDDAETIVDLGGHVGLSTLYFAVRYPRARIVVVEPNPAVHRRLRRNTVGLARAIIDAVAVAGSMGETGLRTGGSSWAARLDESAELRVQTVRLSVLFARHALESVDLLKFDIEGAELDALDLRELDRVAQIVGEVHARGHEQLEMLVARLEPAFDLETRQLEPRWLLRARRRASRPTSSCFSCG